MSLSTTGPSEPTIRHVTMSASGQAWWIRPAMNVPWPARASMPPSSAPTWSNQVSGSVSSSTYPIGVLSRSGPRLTTLFSQACLPQPVSSVATTGRRPLIW